MNLDHVCSKKDKRLLVLLALSLLVMLSDISFPVCKAPAAYNYSWLQIHGDENLTYRYDLNGNPIDFTERELSIDNRLKQKRAVALQKEHDKSTTLTYFSPRLAFFLGQPFSINTANNEDLALIPGIGAVLAGNIVAYREIHGPIIAPSQLENIPGIGPRTVQKLQNYFTYIVDSE